MSEKKKDLSAFLKKNQKKGKKTTTTAAAAETAAPIEEKKEEVTKVQEPVAAKAPKKDDSSDEEVDDELDLETQAMSYGNIQEKKDIAVEKNTSEAEFKGYGFENTTTKVTQAGVVEKKKKDASEITFSAGRPKFGRKQNKGQFGAEFSEGLDDIDDDGKVKSKPKGSAAASSGGVGQREFINLGSKARSGRPDEVFEETKKAPTGIKPTFKGKMKIGGGADEGEFGVKTNYDFKVSYKTNDEEGAGNRRGKIRDKGVPFGQHMDAAPEDDDGFEIVRNKDRKRKVQRANSSSSEEDQDQGTKITRGDARAPRGGRGGFFKNSSKN